MRAVIFRNGGVVLDERPRPEPASDELLVAVAGAGLNGADLSQRAGRYAPPPGTTDVAGLEVAGVVAEAGAAVRRFAVGDRVMAIVSGGGQAEYCVVPDLVAMAVPAGLDLAAAGGYPEVLATAYDALFSQAGLCSGERLLVTGAAGGVGVAAVQMALAAGAYVTASARNPEVRGVLERYGATVVEPADVGAAGPYGVVLELVGAPSLATALEALAIGGRIVVIGTSAGTVVELDLRLLAAKRAVVRASTLRSRPLEEKAILTRLVERHVLPHVERRRIVLPVAATFPLEQAGAAYARFVAPKLGKVLLAPGAGAAHERSGED